MHHSFQWNVAVTNSNPGFLIVWARRDGILHLVNMNDSTGSYDSSIQRNMTKLWLILHTEFTDSQMEFGDFDKKYLIYIILSNVLF